MSDHKNIFSRAYLALIEARQRQADAEVKRQLRDLGYDDHLKDLGL